jgi:hypothetical protein
MLLFLEFWTWIDGVLGLGLVLRLGLGSRLRLGLRSGLELRLGFWLGL